MAQIPMTPGRSRMPGTPNLRTGTGMVSPEDMGSRQFGDWMKLANAVGHAGQAQMRWAIGKYNERADAEARTALAAYSKEMGTLRTQILSTTGSNSFNAAKEMEEYSRMKSEAMAKTLTTPLAKDMFNRARLDYDRQNVEAATRHTLREQERYRQTAIVADNDSLLNDAVMNADNGMVIAGNIQKMKANNAQLYAGMPQDFIDMENRKSASLAAEKVAGAIAVGPGGPQAALNFLNSGIEQEIGDGDLKVKFDALRKQYQAAAGNAEISKVAMSMVDANMAPDAIMRQAYSFYPDDTTGEKARQIIAIADVYANKKKHAANAQAAAYTDSVWQEWAKTGFDATRIPREVVAGNPELTKTMVAYRDTLDKIWSSGKSLDPDLAWVDGKMDMLPSQLKEWLAKPGSYAEMLLKTGGKPEEYNKIRERARKTDEDVMRERGGGGSGGGGESASFKVNELFENSYGSMFTGPLGGAKTFDSGDDAHKQHLNGFRLRYNERVRKEESKVGRKLDAAEQEQVAFGLIKDVRAKRVNLDSTYFDERMAAETASPEMPVAKTELTESEAMLNSGEDVIARTNPATGEPQKFGVLDLNSDDTYRFGVPMRIQTAASKALRAYGKTTLPGGMAAEPGDNIVYLKDGNHIELWDRYWTKRLDVIEKDPSPPAAQPVPLAAMPEPKLSGDIKDDYDKFLDQYGYGRVKKEWVNGGWRLHVPGAIYAYAGSGQREEILPQYQQ